MGFPSSDVGAYSELGNLGWYSRRRLKSSGRLMLFLLYAATFLSYWSLSRNPFFGAVLAIVISAALFCLLLYFSKRHK